jgi:hypothetical protein
MSESKKARRKRKRKNKANALKKGLHDTKRRDTSAIIAKMRSGAGAHGRGRPDKEESRTACRGKVNAEDHMEDNNEEV